MALSVCGTSVFAGTWGGGVYLSTNNGTSWTQVNSGLGNTNIHSLGVSGTNLYAGTIGSGVWRLPLSDVGLSVQANSFKAIATNGSVELTWQTQSEINNLGFNVIRNDAGLIASYTSDVSLRGLGTSTTGRGYSYKDSHIVNGHTYEYTVESVSSDGTKKDYPPIQVTVDIPKDYTLYQNYPNPFNPTTTINYDLPKNSHITLKVYDALGREVATLVDQEKTAGSYQATVDGSRFASGVYFYRIEAGTFSQTKKLLLVK
jgi:hypothetical protein